MDRPKNFRGKRLIGSALVGLTLLAAGGGLYWEYATTPFLRSRTAAGPSRRSRSDNARSIAAENVRRMLSKLPEAAAEQTAESPEVEDDEDVVPWSDGPGAERTSEASTDLTGNMEDHGESEMDRQVQQERQAARQRLVERGIDPDMRRGHED